MTEHPLESAAGGALPTLPWRAWVWSGREAVLLAATFVLVSAAHFMIFRFAPTERVQGEVQRLFYIHISLAWLAYLSFLLVFLGGVLYLWRHGQKWDRLARSAATIGV